jgi:type IV pilus assembly protein PilV
MNCRYRPVPPRRPSALSRRQRGITLLESLIALLVLAVAVLAMAAIQLRTLTETRTGVQRAQAVRIIEDLAERIRSSPDGFSRVASYTAGWDEVLPVPATDCTAAPCTAEELARWDLAAWRQSVARQLPGGRATTFVSPAEPAGIQRQLGVMVGWRLNERSGIGGHLDLLQPAHASSAKPCPDGFICHLVYVQP